MAADSGATADVTTVDGVEPNIEVRYVGNATPTDNTEVLTLFPTDDGHPRSIHLGGDSVLVTEKELRQMEAGYQIQRVDSSAEEIAAPVEEPVEAPTASHTSGFGSPGSSSSSPSGQSA